MNGLITLDYRAVLFFQGMGTWLYPFMWFLSLIGDGIGAVLFSSLMIWSGRTATGLRAGLVSTLAGAVNGVLKLGIRQPRPYWIDSRVQGLQYQGDFGMPSGHAMWSSSFWGYFAYSFVRVRYLVLSLGMIFFIGVSRVYLGVHLPSQVIVGWVAGSVLVYLFIILERPVGRLLGNRSVAFIAVLAFGASLALIATAVLITALSPEFRIPDLWVNNAKVFSDAPLAPLAVDSVVQSAALFFGYAAGGVWWGRRSTASGAGQKAPSGDPALSDRSLAGRMFRRILIGLLGFFPIFAVFYPLSLVAGTVPWLQESILYVQYASVGLWATAGAPLLFRRFALELPEKPQRRTLRR